MERTNELVVKYLRYLKTQPQYAQNETMDVAISCLSDIFRLEGQEQSSELLTMVEAAEPGARVSSEELKQEGNDAMGRKEYNMAYDLYSRAIEESSRSGESVESRSIYYANRASALKAMEKMDLAIDDLNEAVRLNASYQKGWMRLAGYYEEVGRKEDAYKIYKRQNEQCPSEEAEEGMERTAPPASFGKLPENEEELMRQFPMFSDAINDPKIQELLQKPSVEEKLKQVESNPMSALGLMTDPEMQPLLGAIMGKLNTGFGDMMKGFMPNNQ